MAEKKYRLVGGYWIDNSMSFYLKLGAGAWVEVPFTSAGTGGFYYCSDDGTATDLLELFNDTLTTAVAAYPGVGLGGVSPFAAGVRINQTTGAIANLFIWDDTSAVGTMQLKWEHPTTPLTNPTSYFLHNALRLTTSQSATLSILSDEGPVATRCHGYGLYPLRYLMSDLSEWQARSAQAVPDQGQVQTLRSAMLEIYRLGIRLDKAYPRAALFNEYHALVDFMDNAASGRPFRVYPDKTIFTAYADVTNPYGYRTWVLDKDSASWRPEPAVANFYKVLDTDLKCWQWVE